MKVLNAWLVLVLSSKNSDHRFVGLGRVRFWGYLNGRDRSRLWVPEQSLLYSLVRCLNDAIPATETAFKAEPTNAEYQ